MESGVTTPDLKTSNGLVVSTILDAARALPHDGDQVVIDRFLKGDPYAFEQLYAAYYDKVFAIARGIVLDSDDAADAVQEVFTQVYRNLNRFDRRSKFSTWLFRIAVNRTIQFARKHKYRARQTELSEADGQVASVEVEQQDPAIEAALEKLAPADRALLVLFYWEELSLADIAASLGCSENAAKTRLYRARERFRDAYEVDA